MDLLAALALVMVIEGLALVILAKSLPALLAELAALSPKFVRLLGAGLLLVGMTFYIVLRGVVGAG